MTDIHELREELTLDPLARSYSTMTDQQAADDLNTAYVESYTTISSRALLVWAGGNGRIKKIDDARTDANIPEAVQNVCEAAIRLIERDDAAYDPNDPNQAGLLGAMVSTGIITQTDADELNAMGLQTQTRAEELNLLGRSKEIGPAHVAEARI